MLAIPNLPTENLYKFLALGGIIVAITSIFYVLNENKNINIDNVKLETNSNVYDYKIARYTNKIKHLADEVRYDTAWIHRDRVKMNVDVKHMPNFASDNSIYMVHDGEKFTFISYEKFLHNQLSKIVNEYNSNIKKEVDIANKAEEDKIKLIEQKELIEVNYKYLNYLNLALFVVCIIGFSGSFYGFKKWREMQIVSDELAKVQLAKAQNELGDLNKSKLIL